MTTDVDRQADDAFRKSAQNYNAEDSGIHATAHAPQLVQVETLGRHGVLLLFLCALVAAVSSVGFIFTLFELKTVSAQYEVLQYDLQALKAQLVAKGVYEPTEH